MEQIGNLDFSFFPLVGAAFFISFCGSLILATIIAGRYEDQERADGSLTVFFLKAVTWITVFLGCFLLSFYGLLLLFHLASVCTGLFP